MTPVFLLCDEYITKQAALDPLGAGMRGLSEAFRAAPHSSPHGLPAQQDLIVATLASLDTLPVTSEADRLAAAYLRERLTTQLAWHEAREPLVSLSTPFGRISNVRDSVDLLPRAGDDAWRNIAARM